MASQLAYPNVEFLEENVARITRNRAVHGAILCVEDGSGALSWKGAAGNLEPDQRCFIASVTKLYVN